MRRLLLLYAAIGSGVEGAADWAGLLAASDGGI